MSTNVEDKLESEYGARCTFSTVRKTSIVGTAVTQNLFHSTSRGNRLRCHSADTHVRA
jgi:hypothetical protein